MQLASVTREFWDDFINIVFPRVCLSCNTILVYQEEHICTKCRFSLPKTNYHLQEQNLLVKKFAYEPKVCHVSAYLHYTKGGVAQKIIGRLKYHDTPEIGVMMGEWYGVDLVKNSWPIDFILPVPLYPSKLKRRGFNQSERFAEGLSNSMHVPVKANIVSRNRNTSTQTRKTKVQRWQNMDSVYAVSRQSDLQNASVLVVDDVLTTGATIGELVALMSQCGVDSIYIATIAAGK